MDGWGWENYDDLETLYGQVYSQFNRYMGHVTSNIGGVYEHYKTYDQDGAVYTHVTKDHQQNCLSFLHQELFQTPTWLLEEDILNKIDFASAVDRMRRTQTRIISSILDFGRLARMIENEALHGASAYTLVNMMNDYKVVCGLSLQKEIKSIPIDEIFNVPISNVYLIWWQKVKPQQQDGHAPMGIKPAC